MIIVSPCLLGKNCKYNGKNNFNSKIVDFLKDKNVIELCPETLSGLPVPRDPIELKNGIPFDKNGNCFETELKHGVERALEKLDSKIDSTGEKVEFAILQARSPSCGVGKIYDGTFSKNLIEGNGLLTQKLFARTIKCYASDEFEKMLDAGLF